MANQQGVITSFPFNNLQLKYHRVNKGDSQIRGSHLFEVGGGKESTLVNQMLVHLFHKRLGGMNIMSYLTLGMNRPTSIEEMPGVITKGSTAIGTDRYEWMIVGEYVHAPALHHFSVPQGVEDKPGINNTEFTLAFKHQMVSGSSWFAEHDVISSDDFSQMLYVTGVEKRGELHYYTVKLTHGFPGEYYDISKLSPGRTFFKTGTAFRQELSSGGHSSWVTPGRTSGYLQTMRTAYDVTSKALTREGTKDNPHAERSISFDIQTKGSDGSRSTKTNKNWIRGIEMQMMANLFYEVELTKWYSRDNHDKNGRPQLSDNQDNPVHTMAGVLQQIEGHNELRYPLNGLTKEMIDIFLHQLFLNAHGAEGKQWIVFCGYGFFKDFNDAMHRYVKDSGMLVDSNTFLNVSGDEIRVQGHFKEYKGVFGNSVKLVHFPHLDNNTIFDDRHPRTNLPMESHSGYVIDMSSYGGKPNVQHVHGGNPETGESRAFLAGYVNGLVKPGVNGVNVNWNSYAMANDKDGYSVHFLTEFGCYVQNPFSCGIIKCQK